MNILFILIHILIIVSNVYSLKWNTLKDNTWYWKNSNINYICEEKSKKCNKNTSILLIHGFGANSYHWRHNIKELSENYNVYAIDLIGFGKSDKPINIDYNINLWTQQTQDFIDEVIKQDTIVIGNSLGGCIAVNASEHKLIKSIILLNSFVIINDSNPIFHFSNSFIRICVNWLMPIYINNINNKDAIKNILLQVYPVVPNKIDIDLINSIKYPLDFPDIQFIITNIAENFLNNKNNMINIMKNNEKPWYILWGKKDPWIHNSMAETILKSNKHTLLEYVDAGHCPHDEIPEIINKKIETYLSLL